MASSVESRTTARRDGVGAALELSIERRPDPDIEGLSERDAAWPKRLRRIVRAGLTYWRQPDLIETAELLLTELATNALRHGRGCDIGVRIYLQDGRCVIEVNDGSPTRPELRDASPDDEGGRGLFLVESMAEAWGVSPDGTTTWCTLPLPKGPTEMETSDTAATVVRETEIPLPADLSAMRVARHQARMWLTVLGWPGNQHAAVDVLYILVNNAVQYGLTPGKAGEELNVRLGVTDVDELLIDVTDPMPEFPDFERAIRGELGRGLWGAQELGASLTRFPSASGGKTVRATLKPGEVEL